MEDLDELEKQVREIIAGQLDIDVSEVKKVSTIAELGGDSLIALQLLTAFENRFSISIPDEDAVKINSVKTSVEVIRKLLNR